MSVNFEKLETALGQLKNATQNDPANELERDGIIQRFKYTIELLWKVSKKVLEENGVSAIAPKDVVRELALNNWIHNPEELIDYIKLRNESSHSYQEVIANTIAKKSKDFCLVVDELMIILKNKAK
jgi:nucleotidyltransferase substrate binding protein (TIGR01987 family)